MFTSITVEPIHYLGAAVATVGFGLVVGAFVGRALWLIIVGLLLMPALWFTSFWPSGLDWNIGDQRFEPNTVGEVKDEYSLGLGSLKVDLTMLSPEELVEIGRIDASVGMGELVVYVPTGVNVHMNAEVGAGEISGPFNTSNGVGLDRNVEFGSGAETLTLNLEVGAGVIHIRGPVWYDEWSFEEHSWNDGSIVVEINS